MMDGLFWLAVLGTAIINAAIAEHAWWSRDCLFAESLMWDPDYGFTSEMCRERLKGNAP